VSTVTELQISEKLKAWHISGMIGLSEAITSWRNAMSSNSTLLIQQLRADFEKLLALVTGPEAQRATLDQMERSLFRQVLRLGLRLLKLFLATRVEAESHAPQRGKGQTHLPYHSQKTADYFSIFGKLTFARAYFYQAGQAGRCPLDSALSLPERCYSDLLMERAELLSVEGAYDKSLRVLQRRLGLDVPQSALETTVSEHSPTVKTFYQQKAKIPPDEEGPILVAQADGQGVPMVRRETAPVKARLRKGDKKTRKKEAIATAVYTIAPYRRTAQDVLRALFKKDAAGPQRPVPCHKQIFASLDGKDLALQRLAAWVKRREGPQVHTRVALTDGAEALQQHMQAKLPGFTLVLDIIHVDEHLWQAGTALHGETEPQREAWVEAQLQELLCSRTDEVIQCLVEKAHLLPTSSSVGKVLRQVAHYLERNRDYMDYAEYLRQGWPIGTGVIEGTCRHLVKDRMELSGMRWTVVGAGSLLALRAVNENGDWEEFHDFRRVQRHRQVYGTPINKTWLNQVERLEIN
jgi:hypothetical protein